MHEFKTQVLLLHPEQSTLDRFSASLGDAYSVHLATSGTEALNTLGLTPIHVMVSAQKLPGMSGIEALREARKRSPETLGILIAPEDMSGAEVEALVGREEVFQIIHGVGTPEEMRRIIDDALDQLRLSKLQDSANDRSAGPRARLSPTAPPRESAGVRRPPAAAEGERPAPAPETAGATELVVFSKDEVFRDTVRQALSPRQPVHSVDDLRQAAKLITDSASAVLVTDAAVAPRDVEAITTRLRSGQPRLVTIVAGRRDDGDQLMDLINSGMVYRFLLKPISPGRARLAIEAAIRRAREETRPAAPASPGPPPARVEPTLEDFDGAEEVVLSEEEPATRAPARPATAPGAPGQPRPQRKKPEELMAQDETDRGLPRLVWLAGAGVAVAAVVAAGLWYALGDTGDPDTPPPAALPAQQSTAETARSEPPPPPPVNSELLQARAAVADGRLLTPGEDGALALYARALADAPDDAELAAEVDQIVAEAVAGVAAALDAGRPGEARAARTLIAARFPDAPGLATIDRRLAETERERLLERADELAAAGDTDGAIVVLDEAAALLPGRSPAVAAQREALLAAADDRGRTLLLELGNQRLLQGQLVEPAADNARYYYRAVLAQDSDSIAGRQGMAFLRTALITRIRESLEAGDRAAAERWLEEARVSGVEEARLTPFREVAAGLPRSPAAQSPAPADPPESAPATPGPSEEETAAAAPGDATPAPVQPVRESQAPAEPVAPAATDAAAGDAAPQEDTTGEPAPVDEAAAEEAAAEEPAVTDEPAADAPAADGGPVAAVTADTAPAQAVSRGEEPAAADTAPPARPERITYVPPSYPRAAEMRGVEGWVDVEFSLTAAGRPRAIEVTEARPADTFDQAAVEAVSQWRYQPPGASGWPADERIRIRINFGLDP